MSQVLINSDENVRLKSLEYTLRIAEIRNPRDARFGHFIASKEEGMKNVRKE